MEPLLSASVGTRRDLAIQVHGKTLVKNDCRIARADLHFALRQCGKVGKLRSAEVLECAKITGTDGRSVNSTRQLQRLRQGLIGGRYPNRPPLRDSESHEGD